MDYTTVNWRCNSQWKDVVLLGSRPRNGWSFKRWQCSSVCLPVCLLPVAAACLSLNRLREMRRVDSPFVDPDPQACFWSADKHNLTDLCRNITDIIQHSNYSYRRGQSWSGRWTCLVVSVWWSADQSEEADVVENEDSNNNERDLFDSSDMFHWRSPAPSFDSILLVWD